MSGADSKLRDRAYQSFTERILRREIKPGQFVSQRELAEMTGFPLGAIRELVPRLETEGLIVTIPQRGMQIAHVDLGLIRNAFQFRLFLEREAVAIFAESAPEALIAAQRQAHEAIAREAEQGVSADLMARAQGVDLAFHEAIIAHLGNMIIAEAYRVNWIKIRLIRHAETGLLPELVIPVMAQHLVIVEALERRDPQAARETLTLHINGSRDRALGLR